MNCNNFIEKHQYCSLVRYGTLFILWNRLSTPTWRGKFLSCWGKLKVNWQNSHIRSFNRRHGRLLWNNPSRLVIWNQWTRKEFHKRIYQDRI